MSKQEKLLRRFKGKPTDFSWSELETLLAGFGYEVAAGGRTGGSRVRFLHAELPPIMLHRPHPAPVLKRYQIEQMLEFFWKEGVL
ncbi:MAG: type II toxin-antitoxin system HicA family toxin [Desulfuromonas sp.]|nr:type II toxin-antitoxin system HicA family toxin [Desulfuromonas sp.]